MHTVLSARPGCVGSGTECDEESEHFIRVDVEEGAEALDQHLTEGSNLIEIEGADETCLIRISEVEIDQKRFRLSFARLLDKGLRTAALHEEIVVQKIEKLRIVVVADEPLAAGPHAGHGSYLSIVSCALCEELAELMAIVRNVCHCSGCCLTTAAKGVVRQFYWTAVSVAHKHLELYTYKMQHIPKRILRELEDLQGEDQIPSGIFYAANEVNMRNGKGMVIGPEETPYAFCPLIFSVDLPASYPIDSPKVQVLTSDGVTRFHPNLYVGGKVCLSILGTWEGPKWCAVMTIRTVLTSILSILDDNPIANEPGYSTYKKDHPASVQYSEVVQFRLVAYCLDLFITWRSGSTAGHLWEPFKDVFDEHGHVWLNGLWSLIKGKKDVEPVKYSNIVYGMSVFVNWKGLYEKGLAAAVTSPT